jgi:hypothetical protein
MRETDWRIMLRGIKGSVTPDPARSIAKWFIAMDTADFPESLACCLVFRFGDYESCVTNLKRAETFWIRRTKRFMRDHQGGSP